MIESAQMRRLLPYEVERIGNDVPSGNSEYGNITSLMEISQNAPLSLKIFLRCKLISVSRPFDFMYATVISLCFCWVGPLAYG